MYHFSDAKNINKKIKILYYLEPGLDYIERNGNPKCSTHMYILKLTFI